MKTTNYVPFEEEYDSVSSEPMELFAHPREWLTLDGYIKFAPCDTVYGRLAKRGNRYYALFPNGEEPVEVLNPNGHYQGFLKKLSLVNQTEED